MWIPLGQIRHPDQRGIVLSLILICTPLCNIISETLDSVLNREVSLLQGHPHRGVPLLYAYISLETYWTYSAVLPQCTGRGEAWRVTEWEHHDARGIAA